MRGVFVTGTDTGIGKTLVSAWLVRSWRAEYWKPVKSGLIEGADAEVIRALAPGAVIHPSAYLLNQPLSPHEAARRDGVVLRLDAFHLPPAAGPLVVEGAGGLMVPLNDEHLMIDLMERLGLPVVLVARSGLGTINHSLLSIEALHRRAIAIAGVILSGAPDEANKSAIEHFGRVTVVGQLPVLHGAQQLPSLPPLDWQPWEQTA